MFTQAELELLKLICDSDDPEKALYAAMGIISDVVKNDVTPRTDPAYLKW